MKVKILSIIIVILLLVVMSLPVYADTNIPPLPTDGWEYWVVVRTSENELRYYTSHNPIKVSEPNNYQLLLDTYRYFKYTVAGWELADFGSNFKTAYFSNMYSSNHDIEYADGSGFFFYSPKANQLYQTMKRTDFGTILRNFSVGLIPIIGCLILVISFRKGWEFLRTQLNH